MKANRIVWVLLMLMLGAATAQQPVLPNPINSAASRQEAARAEEENQLIEERTSALNDWEMKIKNHDPDYSRLQQFVLERVKRDVESEEVVQKKPLNAVQIVAVAKKAYESVKAGLTNELMEMGKRGNSAAQFELGWRYDNGIGTETNTVEAIRWYQKSAEKGNVKAQSRLGIIYSTGENNVPNDYVEAAKWFSRAALQGDARAQAMLGLCYAAGYGVPKNDVVAYKWMTQANSQNYMHSLPANFQQNLAKLFTVLTANMSRSEIVEAQRLAAEFKPRKESSLIDARDAEHPVTTGTVFFISDDGYLISNLHVVRGATHVRLVTSADLISAKVVKVDAANDLALLKAEGRFVALPVAASRGVKLGGTVATVGFPNIGLQGFAPKLAKGEIASLSGAGDDARYFQISVPVQPGNSGGALVAERGNVVGVVSAKLSAKAALAASGSLPENVNYAVKSSYLLSFLESVPEVSAKLKEPETKERKFEDVVKTAEQAAVLVLVY